MLSEELLTYIRQNQAAGFNRSEIETALKGAGWDSVDIEAGFASLGGTPRAARPSAPVGAATPSSMQSSVDAEVARLRAQTLAARQSKSEQPSTEASGIVGWLIKKKIVSSPTQANIVLIFVMILAIGGSVWVHFHH